MMTVDCWNWQSCDVRLIITAVLAWILLRKGDCTAGKGYLYVQMHIGSLFAFVFLSTNICVCGAGAYIMLIHVHA